MSMARLHIGYAPLSSQIVIYRGPVGGPATEKVDRTSEFIAALLQWTKEGAEEVVVEGDSGSKYTVRVTKEVTP